ncbi:polyhomeotic-like protein 2b isoform X5 [Gadus morhua]|uniref:polyhomeotic-like protein 2b isoform X5 n=1 Tax=Gadus morhua TaxID=8049 RepID=UPI0011B6D4E1|nr:polyhomeotic-like protein 2 isoform X5 [Gadus morhua]
MGALSGTLTEGVIGRHLWRDLCFSFMARHDVCVNGLWCGCCCLRERGQEGFIYTPNPADMLSSYQTERRPLVYPTTKQPDGPGKRGSVGCEIGTLGLKSRHRRAIQKSRGSKVRRAEGTMESEPAAPPSMAGTGGPPPPAPAPPPPPSAASTTAAAAAASSSVGTGSTGAGAAHASTTSASTSVLPSSTSTRQAVPQISVYSGISDRQTVQVIQQALHRQPNTAAQYLQQMYAAQQQHLMHSLSTAQLQSLQASMAVGRQGSSQNGTSSQQGASSQTTINLTTSSGAAQLISRAQSVSSAPTSISQQAVLLGSPSNPTTLTASQAQMYLRAQMQVARSLGRAVPLSSQLIFTPTATNQVQNQVQNLAMRGQQGASMGPQALSLKQGPVPIQPASMIRNPCPQGAAAGAGLVGKGAGQAEGPPEAGKKAEPEVRAINMSRNNNNNNVAAAPPLIAPAYTQIGPHSLVTQHKQQHHHQHHQFVMQQSAQSSQRAQGQLLQTASIQPCPHPVPVLPKPGPHPPAGPHQATIFHSTINPQALHASLGHAKAQPVQLTAINLQIQPTASRMIQASKEKPTSLVVREAGPTSTASPHPHPHSHPHPHPLHLAHLHQHHHHHQQQQQLQPQHQQQQPPPHVAPPPPPPPPPPQPSKPVEPQPKASVPAPPAGPTQAEGVSDKKPRTPPPPAAPQPAPPAMTSGHGDESPAVTASAPHNGENKPPQAIVKPQVLTHVIEGFVIQEGAEPFPVCVERLPVLIHSPRKSDHQLSDDPDKTPASHAANTDSEPDDLIQHDKEEEDEPKLTCEYCGWVDFAYKFKGSKRFCSVVCAKRYNVGCSKRMGLFRPERSKPTNHWRKRTQARPPSEAKKRKSPPSPHQTQGGSVSSPHASQPSQDGSTPCSDMSSYEEPPSPLSAASSGPPPPAPANGPPPVAPPAAAATSARVLRQSGRGSDPEVLEARDLDHHRGGGGGGASPRHFLPCDPTKWNVEEVSEFIRSLPGCQEIADEFRSQEIDGQALLLLKEDHLMSTMNIKLGPALKIYARINMLKDS